jgi:hypothetical protein
MPPVHVDRRQQVHGAAERLTENDLDRRMVHDQSAPNACDVDWTSGHRDDVTVRQAGEMLGSCPPHHARRAENENPHRRKPG